MNNQSNNVDLSQKVMQEIREKKISMRPKIYFVVGAILLVAGFTGLILVSAFLFNLIVFRLRMHAPFGYLKLGRLGIRAFWETFPLRVLLASLLALIGGIVFLKRSDVSYKFSKAVLIVGLITMVIFTGLVFDRIGVNERLMVHNKMQSLYSQRYLTERWVIGEIMETGEGELIIKTPLQQEVKVVWDKGTRFPSGASFTIGEKIRVVGKQQAGVFKAQGIIKGGLKGLKGRPINFGPPPRLVPPFWLRKG